MGSLSHKIKVNSVKKMLVHNLENKRQNTSSFDRTDGRDSGNKNKLLSVQNDLLSS